MNHIIPPARKLNNFGIIRLLLALAVAFSHSSELINGDRSEELFTSIFGTVSMGEVAVAGFFIISGYLISKSYINQNPKWSYFVRRCARILPGFLIAFAFSTLIAVSVSHQMQWSKAVIIELFKQLVTLRPPLFPGAFSGLPYPIINGSLWTIAYEFRCYIAVPIFATLGLFRGFGRWIFLIFSMSLVVANAFDIGNGLSWPASSVIGVPQPTISLFGFFCIGVCFNIFEEKYRFDWRIALGFMIILICALFSPAFNQIALATLGGYVLLWLAISAPQWSLGRWTDSLDLSYGIYLFAWPIQNMIIFNFQDIEPWQLFILTTIISGALAFISFIIIEKPSQLLAARWLGAYSSKPTSTQS